MTDEQAQRIRAAHAAIVDGERCGCVVCDPVAKPADIFPGDRKQYPIYTGLLLYFPNACAAVAYCSYVANEQHNPGEPMHWAFDKSIGKGDELLRHMVDSDTAARFDKDKVRHSAKAAWRALEKLEREILAERDG